MSEKESTTEPSSTTEAEDVRRAIVYARTELMHLEEVLTETSEALNVIGKVGERLHETCDALSAAAVALDGRLPKYGRDLMRELREVRMRLLEYTQPGWGPKVPLEGAESSSS